MMRGWIATFDRWDATLERAIPLGDGVVAVGSDRIQWLLDADGSPPAVRFTCRAGLIVRARFYSTAAEALKAVGLEE
jgi:hypothetical protein